MGIIRDLGLLVGRVVLGSYLIGHGVQKLFGALDGPGLKVASQGFEQLGLRPGIVMATAASVSEIGGGLLTATGALSPLGPVALAGTMAVASTTRRVQGPFATKGGYELALTDFSAALVLAVMGPGRISADHLLGLRIPRWKTAAGVLGSVVAAAAMIRTLLATPAPPTPPRTEPTSEAQDAARDAPR